MSPPMLGTSSLAAILPRTGPAGRRRAMRRGGGSTVAGSALASLGTGEAGDGTGAASARLPSSDGPPGSALSVLVAEGATPDGAASRVESGARAPSVILLSGLLAPALTVGAAAERAASDGFASLDSVGNVDIDGPDVGPDVGLGTGPGAGAAIVTAAMRDAGALLVPGNAGMAAGGAGNGGRSDACAAAGVAAKGVVTAGGSAASPSRLVCPDIGSMERDGSDGVTRGSVGSVDASVASALSVFSGNGFPEDNAISFANSSCAIVPDPASCAYTKQPNVV